MNYQCSNEFILALRDIAQICEENNTDNLRLSFDISDNRELRVYISFEVKENNDDKKHTNADRIRSMSDEELARENIYFASALNAKEGLHYTGLDGNYYRTAEEVVEANMKWLQSEVEE